MSANIKRFVAGLAAVCGTMALLTGVASATTTTQTVKGVVSQSGSPLAGLALTVQCVSKIHNLTTDSAGKYSTTFSSNVCPIGQTVTVAAHNGSATGSVNAPLHSGTNTINLALTAVSVPELVPVAGLGAAIVAAAGFMLARRRALHGLPASKIV